jgi:3-hydroxybutyryl-CoA dehydrogenase
MDISRIKSIAIIGAGIMGEGMIQVFAQSGFLVNVIDKNTQILEKCLNQVKSNVKLFKSFGLIKESEDSVIS